METICKTTCATCEDCGARATFTGPCPYMEEIYDAIEIVTICDRCFEQRCDEV